MTGLADAEFHLLRVHLEPLPFIRLEFSFSRVQDHWSTGGARMSVSPEHYAGFLERMGHHVRCSGGLWWFDVQNQVYTSFPFHRSIDANTVHAGEVLGLDGLVLRFGCPAEQGTPSFRVMCSNPDYDFPCLRSRTRTQVRRGLEACEVRRVDFSDLSRDSIALHADTLQRQGRRIPDDLERTWRRYYAEAARTIGAEAWAAYVNGEMAACLVAFVIEDVSNLLIVRSSLQYLESFPNNALIYTYLHTRLRQGDISTVSYGYQSIQAGLDSLDQFKTGMGFDKVPTGQRVEFAGWLRPIVNRTTIPLLQRLLLSRQDSEQRAKLLGMLQWYCQQPRRSQLSRDLRVA